jgi:hypothetical protein
VVRERSNRCAAGRARLSSVERIKTIVRLSSIRS